MFSTFVPKMILSCVVVATIYGSSFYLFVARGDVYYETPQTTLMYISYVMTATNVIGLVNHTVSDRVD
ncbi:hypothetical protein OSTOST_07574 [Ostertagia ostertagi]